jgi:thiazole synthase
MRLTVNGRPAEVQGPISITGLLTARGVAPERVVVAVGGAVVPRERWDATWLQEGDVVEVVHIVAGGAEEGPAGPEGWRDPQPLVIAGRAFRSRLFCGTGKFPSPDVARRALEASGTEMVTVAIRYMNLDGGGGPSILDEVDLKRYHLLPNTAGATTVDQAVHMARLARAATGTNWVKLEIIGESSTLWPDTAATVEATRILVREGFVVLPYTSPDLVAALRLEEAGAATVMPLASPIGSGQGFIDWSSIRRIKERVRVPVVVDAGLGAPSDAAMAMELGADAVLINTGIARAGDPVLMAQAMRLAVEAGRRGYVAGRIPKRDLAVPSSPTEGVPAAAGRAALE